VAQLNPVADSHIVDSVVYLDGPANWLDPGNKAEIATKVRPEWLRISAWCRARSPRKEPFLQVLWIAHTALINSRKPQQSRGGQNVQYMGACKGHLFF
jgi:hypothetical protein